MKTSSSKSYDLHRPLQKDPGIAFRQQEASPNAQVILLQQTARGTLRPPALPSTQRPCFSSRSTGRLSTRITQDTQHPVAANATSHEDALMMHTHPRCSKYTLNQEWSYKNRRSGCPEFGQSFIPHNYDAQKSAGSGSLDFWTKHYSKYSENIMIQSRWPEHDHTCHNAHFPPSCNNNKQHQHERDNISYFNIL